MVVGKGAKLMSSLPERIGNFFKSLGGRHRSGISDFLNFAGPGLLVTVGFIDPGNWATNVAAGSQFGLSLLWVVTLSTIMLILLQHNVAHLGIVTGLCLSEAVSRYFPRWLTIPVLGSAVLAGIATQLAEILGAAIGLRMLTGLPIILGAMLSSGLVVYMLFSNSYRKLEKWIMGFVTLIGLAFLFELTLVPIEWKAAAQAWVTPAFPGGSWTILMGILGAVVMPHNLFLHSEIIQSRQWNKESEEVIARELRFEFLDTMFSMIVGWAINSSMILMAAGAFYSTGHPIVELEEAQHLLKPLLGDASATVFAIALLMAGFASSVTAGMAGGSIFAGIFDEPYNINDSHTILGIGITVTGAMSLLLLVSNPFRALILSQVLLSIQLPITIVAQIYLTSSTAVMGKYANNHMQIILLSATALLVIVFNVMLLWSTLT